MGKRKQQLGDLPMDGTQPQVEDDESDEVSPAVPLQGIEDVLT